MSRGQLRQTHPISGQTFNYTVESLGNSVSISQNNMQTELSLHSGVTQQGWCRIADGTSHAFAYQWIGNDLHLWLDGRLFIFQRQEPTQRQARETLPAGDEILAPMPGRVMQVLVSVGENIALGDRLLVMESMKMELVIDAPRAGVVKRVAVAEGDQVDKGMRLVELEPVT